jgi:DNA-binding response OmpR family regulator
MSPIRVTLALLAATLPATFARAQDAEAMRDDPVARVYIHRLRKKIEQGPVRIATVRGLGYCLEKIAA